MMGDKVPITCIMDEFNLLCPVCANDNWLKEPELEQWYKCTDCGIEVRIQQHPKYHCMRMELQGA